MLFLLGYYIADVDDETFIINMYKQFYPLVRKTIKSILGNDIKVDDLVNKSFLSLIKHVPLLKTLPSKKLITYIIYTSKNITISFITNRDVNNKYYYFTEEFENKILYSDSLEEQYIYKEEIHEYIEIIFLLPDKYRDILFYRYYLDISIAKLANMLAIEEGSVWKILQRAKAKARQLLQKRGETFEQ